MNIKKAILFFIFIVTISVVNGQQNDSRVWLQEQQLPEWFIASFKAQKLDTSYKVSDYINPFYIEGDFNGDGKIDIAVLIEEKTTKKKGILICHANTNQHFIVGAGKKFGNGGDDFSWMDIWKVYRKTKVEKGVGETNTITLKGQAILTEKSEAASGLIYWTGSNYKWYQQGD